MSDEALVLLLKIVLTPPVFLISAIVGHFVMTGLLMVILFPRDSIHWCRECIANCSLHFSTWLGHVSKKVR